MGYKNGEPQQRPLPNSPHRDGGLCAPDVQVEPPRILIPRGLEALKEHVRQEAAIVSKHAESSQKTSVALSESPVFLFRKSGTELSKKHKPHGWGGSPDL